MLKSQALSFRRGIFSCNLKTFCMLKIIWTRKCSEPPSHHKKLGSPVPCSITLFNLVFHSASTICATKKSSIQIAFQIKFNFKKEVSAHETVSHPLLRKQCLFTYTFTHQNALKTFQSCLFKMLELHTVNIHLHISLKNILIQLKKAQIIKLFVFTYPGGLGYLFMYDKIQERNLVKL